MSLRWVSFLGQAKTSSADNTCGIIPSVLQSKAVAGDDAWEVRVYETPERRTPVVDLLQDLPAKHRRARAFTRRATAI